MKIILFLLLTCSIAAGQTGGDLRRKYGLPISETFKVRPDVKVIVSYDRNGKASEMVIEPQLDATIIKSRYRRIKSKMLKEIIDELVPPDQRGKLLMGSFLNLACLPENDCYGASEEYERVIIYRNGGDDEHRYATIQWKSGAFNRPAQPNKALQLPAR
jgi:hypothetical protein